MIQGNHDNPNVAQDGSGRKNYQEQFQQFVQDNGTLNYRRMSLGQCFSTLIRGAKTPFKDFGTFLTPVKQFSIERFMDVMRMDTQYANTQEMATHCINGVSGVFPFTFGLSILALLLTFATTVASGSVFLAIMGALGSLVGGLFSLAWSVCIAVASIFIYSYFYDRWYAIVVKVFLGLSAFGLLINAFQIIGNFGTVIKAFGVLSFSMMIGGIGILVGVVSILATIVSVFSSIYTISSMCYAAPLEPMSPNGSEEYFL